MFKTIRNAWKLPELRRKLLFVIFALLTIIPIVWIVALNNHCSLHPHLEWREWLVAVFAPLMWLAWFWTDRRKKAVECR